MREALGQDTVFLDEQSLGLGRFGGRLLVEISCNAMIAVIGSAWYERIKDFRNAQDWVRRELKVGLERGVLMVPVLLARRAFRRKPSSLHRWPDSFSIRTFTSYPRHRKEAVDDLIDAFSRELRLSKRRQGQAAIQNLAGYWSDTAALNSGWNSVASNCRSPCSATAAPVGQDGARSPAIKSGFHSTGQGNGSGTVSPDGDHISGEIQYAYQRFGFSISRD